MLHAVIQRQPNPFYFIDALLSLKGEMLYIVYDWNKYLIIYMYLILDQINDKTID